MNVAEYFVELLLREGVTHVFSVPGGTALPLMEAISRASSVRVVVCKDELGAAFMADGYAWASGKPGVVVTIGGPGATNALTGLCCAAAQGNPVVLVSGEVSTQVMGHRAAQDGSAFALDVAAISRPATVLSVAAGSACEAASALEEAFRRAVRLRRPAHVSLPLDVQRAEAGRASVHSRSDAAGLATLSPSAVARAAQVLSRAGQRVAFLLGSGARGASEEVLALAERLGAPVATTCGGKGTFPEHHPLSLGVFSFGSGPLSRAALTSGLDVLVAIGTGLGEFASMNYAPSLRPQSELIHIDTDPAVFERNYASLPVCGDAQLVCRALIEQLGRARVGPPAWLSGLQASHPRVFFPEHAVSDQAPIKPERVMRELELALPRAAVLLADIGTSCLWVAHCVRLSPPQRCYIPMAWSCMGHPLGAALGARLGSGLPTLCVAGDAAFLAKGLELHAAVELGVSQLVCVVLSNRGHGLVRLGTRALVGPDRGVEDGTFARSPDIAGIARAVGADALSVRAPGELSAAIEHGLNCGRPSVINVVVDPDAQPPMGDRLQGLGKTRA